MSTKPLPPQEPNSVPEEDLNLHENFAPIIAENGLIRQHEDPEVSEESLSDFLTRLDTLQDLVALRHAEQEEQEKQQAENLPDNQTVTPEASSTAPLAGEVSQPGKEGESKSTASLQKAPETSEEEPLPQAATTALTVRNAQTTALVTTSKLTLARRITLLKRKRQHKRRLAQRAERHAAQVAVKPPTPQQNSSSAQNPAPKRPNRWKWALAVLLLVFLGGISGLVPVEKIPLLRNLAYAMGFDKTDTARMSFLRALLTWTDKTIGLPGNWADEGGATTLFAGRFNRAENVPGTEAEEDPAVGLSARFARSGGQTSLIDMQALNMLQRQKGYTLDGVRGAVQLTPGQEEADLGPAVVRDDKVNVRTEANIDKGEVFFGSDTSAVNRDFKDGYDSTKMLAKIKNPHIADGVPIDWLFNMTQRLMQKNTPLGGVNRQLEGARVFWGDNIAQLGKEKANRDLYYAWIASRMGQRASNVMLKKSLADVGFLGADLPQMASVALGGGVQIDSMSFQEDQEEWKEYLEWEQKCKETIENEGSKIQDAWYQFNKLEGSKAANLHYPPNCYEATTNGNYNKDDFKKSISQVQSSCETLLKSYQALENACRMVASVKDCSKMTDDYDKQWDDNVSPCVGFLTEAFNDWNKKHPDDQKTLEQYKNSDEWKDKGGDQKINFVIIQDTMTNHSRQFATLIRGREIDKKGPRQDTLYVPEDMNDTDNTSGQLEKVQESIKNEIIQTN
ncbi:MAG: hypothetical protein J6Q05_01405 [Elusimicrobiaceae bacterium]|nr:hypothetical protein [Elusimicrobiaceae bacterium]